MPRKKQKKRKQRKRKKQLERKRAAESHSEPDEVFTAGPLTVVRRGTVVETSVNWEPEAFAEMRAAIPERRERLREEISTRIKQAVSLIEACDPLTFLPLLFIKNCIVDPETYSEPEHEGKEARVEYAHSLIMSAPSWGTEHSTEEQFAEFEMLVDEILNLSLHYFMLREGKEDSPMEVEATKFLGMVRHLFIRGSSMVEHDTDLLRAIYGPHDAMLERHGLFTADELIAFCDRVSRSFEDGLTKQATTYRKMRQAHAQFVEMLDADPALDPTTAIELARDSELVKEVGDAVEDEPELMSPLFPHRIPHANNDDRILSALAMAQTENSGFLTFQKSPGWPSNNSDIYKRPLIECDGAYFCPNPVLLPQPRNDHGGDHPSCRPNILREAVRGEARTRNGGAGAAAF